MRDAKGNELHAGDSVLICLTSPYIFAKVVEVHAGGTVLSLGKGKPPGTMTDAIEVSFQFRHNLADAMPGDRHPTVWLTVDPERDKLVRTGD